MDLAPPPGLGCGQNQLTKEVQPMSTQVKVESGAKAESHTGLLTKVLRADGVFALISGAVLLIGSQPIARLLDLSQPVWLILLGVVLLGYGGELLYFAGREDRNRLIARVAVVLNLMWVLGSYAGLLLNWFPVNTAGKWAIALVAEVVFVFAILEIVALRRQE